MSSAPRALALVAAVAAVAAGCGPARLPGELRVDRLPGDAAAALALGAGGAAALHEEGCPARAPRGASAFSVAQVDGLRISLLGVALVRAGGGTDDLDLGAPRIVELRSGSSEIALTAAVDVPIGSYAAARARFAAAFEVKGYCRTASRLVYTTADGVRAIPIEAGAAALPADYGYAPAAFGDAAAGAVVEESRYDFMVHDAGTPAVSLLIDAAYAVSCYDGTAAPGDADRAALAPFADTSGAPSLAIAHLPLFTWVTSEPGAARPVAETYLAAADEATLAADGADFSRVAVTTAMFDARGGLLALRSRALGSCDGTGLAPYYDRVVETAPGVYDALNGGWWRGEDGDDDGDGEGRQVHDRRLVGFARQRDFTTLFHAALADGPDCGRSLLDGGGNAARACLAAPAAPLAWRRAER
ncbi:MAG: hypothetical protein ACJ79L_01990 [Anaeromyxobacteraceae bacterium]